MIYFIKNGDEDEVKIGYTGGESEIRLSQLQTGNPKKLKVLKIIEGTVEDETKLKRRFAIYNIRGEWFRYSDEIKRYIETGQFANITVDDLMTYRAVLHLMFLQTQTFDVAWQLIVKHWEKKNDLEGGNEY